MTMLDQFRPDSTYEPRPQDAAGSQKKYEKIVYEPGIYNAELKSVTLHDSYIMFKFVLLDFNGADIVKFIKLEQSEKGLKYTRSWLTILMRNITTEKEYPELYKYWESHQMHDVFNKLSNRKIKIELSIYEGASGAKNDITSTHKFESKKSVNLPLEKSTVEPIPNLEDENFVF